MTQQIISVPDIGGAEGVEVIEISVAVGDMIEADQGMVVLETDKASMDIPCPVEGMVTALKVSVGDKVAEGDALIEVDTEMVDNKDATAETDVAESESKPVAHAEVPGVTLVSEDVTVLVPEGAEGAEVIEVSVAVGDRVEEGDSLVVLETDKASMEVPAPQAGKVVSIALGQGDKTVTGGEILVLSVESSGSPSAERIAADKSQSTAPVIPVAPQLAPAQDHNAIVKASQSEDVYAGPAVRKFAREMAVDLTQITGSSDRGRISKADVKAYVKQMMNRHHVPSETPGVTAGSGIPAIPEVDFSQFGDIELLSMSKVKKLTAANMSRNWLNIPHVTQFDEADITDLEAFRKSLKAEAEQRGVKITPLPFLLKACAAALVAEPSFNVSMHCDGEHIVQRKYVNIGVAVDSPIGLVVPVIRDVDKKGLWELAAEFMTMVARARDSKLGPKDMQGGCFTISSLGAMGGQGFTPIVNAPEVAILGVSKAEIKPQWNGSEFVPRNMLPLSLSYDHRAINGGDAGRFFSYLNRVIGDVRRLLL
ncbi:dihydrolipoamide acetyltransferase [Candidatus Endobugula sertula]|uniref:Dihydrolipoamide acetyltransferase component of pyruvate dehydrogenase complex n=1 Tax=Candidatus Endobugula sertula TaxID=62101 RepID=A0A1D2QMD9_9GAMM|nr:dihydrolipoamide acetyltransferase [Candidatus Endobugula sertula]